MRGHLRALRGPPRTQIVSAVRSPLSTMGAIIALYSVLLPE
jgi:hypothetical protein